ncbi:hypothetical protein ACX3P5_20290 (plasmid) [Pantoea sp. S-LA4]
MSKGLREQNPGADYSFPVSKKRQRITLYHPESRQQNRAMTPYPQHQRPEQQGRPASIFILQVCLLPYQMMMITPRL